MARPTCWDDGLGEPQRRPSPCPAANAVEARRSTVESRRSMGRGEGIPVRTGRKRVERTLAQEAKVDRRCTVCHRSSLPAASLALDLSMSTTPRREAEPRRRAVTGTDHGKGGIGRVAVGSRFDGVEGGARHTDRDLVVGMGTAVAAGRDRSREQGKLLVAVTGHEHIDRLHRLQRSL